VTKRNKIFVIIGAIAVIVLTVGLTFAYFSWQSEDKTSVSIGVEHVEVIYNGGSNIIGASLNPTYTKEEGILKEMSILVNRSDLEPKPTVTITLVTTVLPIELQHESFKYVLLKNEEEVASGNFSEINENTEILLTNQVITTSKDNYKLYLWIDGNMDNPSSMTNKEFTFTLKVSGLHAIYTPISTKVEAKNERNVIKTNTTTNLIEYFNIGDTYNGNSTCYIDNVIYETPETLSDGEYEVVCVIENGYGIETSANTILVIDGSVPNVTAIESTSYVNLSSETKAEDLFNFSELGISGGTKSCTANGNEVTNLSDLEDGSYTLTCSLTSGLGESSSASTNLILDRTVPEISAKQTSFTYQEGANVLSESLFNTSSYGTSGGNTVCVVGTNIVSNISTLATGTHTLTCTMTTGTGNSASASTSLVVDGTTPQISAKQASFTITPGTNALATSYFNIGSYGISGGTTECKVGNNSISNVSTLAEGTYTLTCTMTTGAGISSSASTSIIVKNPNAETSGANAPELFEGLIPIKWSGTTVVKANVDNPNNDPWYNYGSKQWANAVMVTSSTRSTYMSASVGSTINTSDILAYFVWIPRYRYELFNVGFTSGTSPRTINIVFESTSTTESTGSTNGTYLTHPAFTFGNTKLSGFWVAKFEPSGASSAGNLKVLPGVSSLRSMAINAQYNASKLFANTAYLTQNGVNTIDAHMMKNTEWGAVTYLSHSIYGKNAEVSINSNSSYITGGGTGTAYTTNIAQSTTGNVYGVYDMNGCGWENVMGNYNKLTGSSGLTVTSIDSKYVDIYTGTTVKSSILGDATGEVAGWYSDHNYFVDSGYPWFGRGFDYSGGTGAGLFVFYRGSGETFVYNSFRPILSAK